jgi:hypothetical protein
MHSNRLFHEHRANPGRWFLPKHTVKGKTDNPFHFDFVSGIPRMDCLPSDHQKQSALYPQWEPDRPRLDCLAGAQLLLGQAQGAGERGLYEIVGSGEG